MDLLFVVPYAPNPIRVRPYNLIRSLSRRGHRITLLTLHSDAYAREALAEMEAYCSEIHALPLPTWRSLLNCLLALPRGIPLQAVYSWHPELAATLKQLAVPRNGRGGFDLVHIEHLRGVKYGLFLQQQPPGGQDLELDALPVIWDSVDCISHLFAQSAARSASPISRLITRFELRRTRHYESWLIKQFPKTLVTSARDRRALLDLGGEHHAEKVKVLPNGVDLEYFSPGSENERNPNALVISGKMSYHANVSMTLFMINEVMPRIWERRPETELWVVGKGPPAEIQKLGKHPLIQVTGQVTDIRPYLQRAAVAVAPLRYGAGIQNKILEAMACGTPVVTTGRAAAALKAEIGRELMIAEDAAGFARIVHGLLGDPSRQRKVGMAGRAYVEVHHDWNAVTARLEEIYRDTLPERPRNVPTAS